ncbi:MAG TPA: DoxX family protein [Polyangiaceae bacterium]|nr:DoxX family protein [Polyangiaceae bacterium]
MTTLTASLLSDRSSLSNATGAAPAPSYSKKAIWTGRVLTGFAALFLAFDGIYKLVASPEAAAAATVDLGWRFETLRGLGVLEIVCLALYLVPRTAPIGALLWTGYLGGAIATHLRIGNPWASHTLFPIYVAVFIWGGLWLRDRRVRAFFAR